MKTYRIEEDFLGKKEIDINVYYGVQTLRAKENFNVTGYTLDEILIKSLALVKKACALANTEIGKIDEKISNAIIYGADEIINGKYHNQFIVDPIQGGAGTSINMNANEVIANIALEYLSLKKGDYKSISPIDHVNMSQSTNDVVPTAVHIATLIKMEELTKALESLISSFKNKEKEFDDIIKMGRTHLQDAVPIRLGQEFSAYSSVLKRDLNRIKQTRVNLEKINIGATAVGTGLNANSIYIEKVIKYLKEFTGFNISFADNLVDATQNTDCYTEVSSSLKICMINISKIANDLRLMASGPKAGLGEINLPPMQPGSSIMPGKVNPVMAELINQVAFQVIGNDNTICLASGAGQFELNVMFPVLAYNLLQSITIMTNALKSFDELCVKGISANTSKMKEYVDSSVGVITALLPYIGYEKAAQIAKEALRTNKSIRYLCLKYKILEEKELDSILDPYKMTSIGVSKKTKY